MTAKIVANGIRTHARSNQTYSIRIEVEIAIDIFADTPQTDKCV